MVEQHSIETLGDARARIHFQVSAETTADEYGKIARKYAKDIEVKGFRKGKVPMDLLERKFGKEFRSEAFNEILDQCSKEVLQTAEPKPLAYAQPYLCDASGQELKGEEASELIGQFRPGAALEFFVGYDTAPEVPEPKLDDLKFEATEAEISDADVAAKLKELREQNGVMVERKDALGAEGDTLSLQFALLEEGQEAPVEDSKLRTIVRLGEPDAQGFHDEIKGLKSGEIKVIEAHTFPDEMRVEEELRGKTGRVWLQLTSIRSRELPELDDEFAQDIDEKHQTLDDLKNSIHAELEHETKHVAENYSLLQIYRHWIETLSFAIPRTMAAYQTQSVMESIKERMGGQEQGLMMYLAMQHEGDVQKGLSALEKEATLGLFVDLLRGKLLESKDWKASEEEIQRELEHVAKHQKTSVEDLKERYKDQQEEWNKYLAESALSARLSRELVAEAQGNGKAKKLGLTELKEKVAALEKSCQEQVFDKFSPFASEGGLLKQAGPEQTEPEANVSKASESKV